MAPSEAETIKLHLADDLDQFHRRKVARAKAWTANFVTIALVCGTILAMILYTLTAWINPDATASLEAFYDRWFTFVGPLVGAAVGFYFGAQRKVGD